MSRSEKSHCLTRRSFLKTTGIMGASCASAGLFSGCAEVKKESENTSEAKVCATTCMSNCHGMGCPLDVTVRGGNACDINKFVMSDRNLQAVCQRGYTNIERLYSPSRVKYPMRRVGERGAGDWERISWDQAINEIAETWKSIIGTTGPTGIVFSKGTGAASNASIGYFDRLVAYLGAAQIPLPYDQAGFWAGTTCIGLEMPYTYWGTETRGLLDAKKIFVWGANPTEAATISYHHISKARENGAKLFVIDPIFTATAAKADKFVQIRPGSDALLGIGMMKLIVEQGAEDREFLSAQTVAPYLVKEADGLYLRTSDLGLAEPAGEDDVPFVMTESGEVAVGDSVEDPVLEGSFDVQGHKVTTAYSLLLRRLDEYEFEEIERQTDIPKDVIECLTAEYLDGPSMIFTALGLDHWVNGHTGYMAMYALMMLSGQLGKLGGGATVGDSSVPQAVGWNAAAIISPADAPVGAAIPASQFYDAVFNGDGSSPQPRSLYFWTHNPIGNLPERKKWLEIFDAMDLVVVADPWMTESAQYADIVLPVTHMWESESISTAGNPYMRLMEKCVEPQFETQGDFEIANLLGCAMGMDEKFQMTREEFLAAGLDNPLAQSVGVSWDRLKKEKRIYTFPEETPRAGCMGWNTSVGRATFYRENPQPVLSTDRNWDPELESLPYWEPPHEGWYENELAEKYPIVFMSERSKFRAHTQFWNANMLLELDSEPFVRISSDDASARGIVDGDTVKVFNDRGYVVLKAVVNPGVRQGIALIDHGWQKEDFIDGHYSDLSSNYSSNVVSNACFFDCLCDIVKM